MFVSFFSLFFAAGHTPRRDMYLCLGHDEEVGGKKGAGCIARGTRVYIYIYIYICIYIHIYIHTYMHSYFGLTRCMYVCMYTHVYTHTHTYIYTRVPARWCRVKGQPKDQFMCLCLLQQATRRAVTFISAWATTRRLAGKNIYIHIYILYVCVL